VYLIILHGGLLSTGTIREQYRKGKMIKNIKEKIVSILWRIWGYIHEDIYRCVEHSYLYRRWDYKLRRVFNLSCREKGRLGIGRKGEPRIITRWKKLCDGFCDFVTELEYKWDV